MKEVLKTENLQQQLYNQLAGMILRRELPPGKPLPSFRELEKLYQVSSTTVRRVMERLQREKLIHTRRNRPALVTLPEPSSKHLRIGVVMYQAPNVQSVDKFAYETGPFGWLLYRSIFLYAKHCNISCMLIERTDSEKIAAMDGVIGIAGDEDFYNELAAGSRMFVNLMAGDNGGKLQEVKTPFYARAVSGKVQSVGKSLIANRNGVTRPAVLTKPFGKGKLIYYPGTYGAANCINELMVGKKYKFVRDPAMDALQKQLLSDLADQYRTWIPQGLPENIFTASYYQDDKMVLHFLNATNWELPAGSVIEFGIRENPFPPVKDIVFEVPRRVKKAYAVSPDYEGKKELKTVKTAKGTQITLPGELLKIYTLVYVE